MVLRSAGATRRLWLALTLGMSAVAFGVRRSDRIPALRAAVLVGCDGASARGMRTLFLILFGHLLVAFSYRSVLAGSCGCQRLATFISGRRNVRALSIGPALSPHAVSCGSLRGRICNGRLCCGPPRQSRTLCCNTRQQCPLCTNTQHWRISAGSLVPSALRVANLAGLLTLSGRSVCVCCFAVVVRDLEPFSNLPDSYSAGHRVYCLQRNCKCCIWRTNDPGKQI